MGCWDLLLVEMFLLTARGDISSTLGLISSSKNRTHQQNPAVCSSLLSFSPDEMPVPKKKKKAAAAKQEESTEAAEVPQGEITWDPQLNLSQSFLNGVGKQNKTRII